MYGGIRMTVNLNPLFYNVAQVYEQQKQQQQELKNAIEYTDRIYESGRDMRDQYCRGDYNDACVSAEQVTEYSLNAIAELNGGLPKKYRNHTTLVDKKEAYCPDLPVSNDSLKNMEMAYKNRYPHPKTKKIQYHFTKDEAQKMISDACEIGDYALDALDISLQDRFEQFGKPAEVNDIDSFKMVNLLFNGSASDVTYNL